MYDGFNYERDKMKSKPKLSLDTEVPVRTHTPSHAVRECFFFSLLRVPRRCEVQLAAKAAHWRRIASPNRPLQHHDMQHGRATADEAYALGDTPKSWGGKPTPCSRTAVGVGLGVPHAPSNSIRRTSKSPVSSSCRYAMSSVAGPPPRRRRLPPAAPPPLSPVRRRHPPPPHPPHRPPPPPRAAQCSSAV